jgi:hypothetical protein
MHFKLKWIAIILILFVVIFIISNLIPIKMAVNRDAKFIKKSNNFEDAIICKNEQVTGATWAMIGNKNGLFADNKGEYIHIEGSTPENALNSSLLKTPNKYIFYGKFTGNRTVDGEKNRVFLVSAWEIVYPVKRDTIRGFFTSSKYLNIFDFQWLGKN